MYFGFLGGSALLHLLAAHPKVLAMLGIAATVSMLGTSLGPRNYLGAGRQMTRIEQRLAPSQLVDAAAVEGLATTARRLATMPAAEVESMVREVLRQCGNWCEGLTPAIVMNDASLLQSALVASELERRSASVQPLTSERIGQLLTSR